MEQILNAYGPLLLWFPKPSQFHFFRMCLRLEILLRLNNQSARTATDQLNGGPTQYASNYQVKLRRPSLAPGSYATH